ncbi:hypothetical protein FA13DRAFT_1395397 [Coprinellus micaceus]|uniref:Uncharacterized protein n=1 Tax=Coprinellus micaceus TaxID=71717 RepID=A0A4Y7SPZ9_COPMI|nr:hypothetical protein FA13DRAFT_1395397 [Coprinellus micaceus]
MKNPALSLRTTINHGRHGSGFPTTIEPPSHHQPRSLHPVSLHEASGVKRILITPKPPPRPNAQL